MSRQGEPSSGQPDGDWWDGLYQGPDDEVPDAPGADPGRGSVDDWFASASGVISGDVPPWGGRAAGTEPVGTPTVVDEPPRKPVLPEQPTTSPVPGAVPPAGGTNAPPLPPVGGVPAPPPLPPLPMRPPRIPPQAVDPRIAASRALDRNSATDRYDVDALDADLYQEAYEEPQAVRDARADLPDRPVRDLDAVREANEAAAAEEAEATAEETVTGRAVPTAPPSVPEPTPTGDPDSTTPADPHPASGLAPSAGPAPAAGRTPTLAAQPIPAPDGALPQVGAQPPAYEPEPTALPAADPDLLLGIVPDTALDGARYGTMTLRAASVRGDAARHLGRGRSDRMLTVRFGEGSDALLLVVLATPPGPENPAPADEACRQLAAAVGRSRAELLADLRVGAQERLRYGLQRLTARAAVRLQHVPTPVRGDGLGGALHALIAPLDPTSRLRAGFGLGPGALLLLGDDAWYDAYAGRRLVAQQPGGGAAAAASTAPQPFDRFRFRVVAPEPGDVLLLCSDGLAQPLREEPAVSDFLADHWAHPHPPGTVDFLRQVQVRAKGYAADRTAAALWED